MKVTSQAWWFLENYVYSLPEPPPRNREKPLEVMCVGLPRSGTESLQQALLKLGYDYTYHYLHDRFRNDWTLAKCEQGWDILFEQPLYIPQWAYLARHKFFPLSCGLPKDTASQQLTAADFDAVIGHCTALTEASCAPFVSDLLRAYPDIKVVLNKRRNVESWHASVVKNLVPVQKTWSFWMLSWFCAEMFWMFHIYERLLWPGLFQCLDGELETGIARNGLRIHEEHCAMVRGLVPEERLLEWAVEDGWGPLCKFLGKGIPRDEKGQAKPFPNTNDALAFQARGEQILKDYTSKGIRNFVVTIAVLGGASAAIWMVMKR